MAVKNCGQKRSTATSGQLVKATNASYVYVYNFCTSYPVRLEYSSLFVGLRCWGLRGNKRRVCQYGGG